MQFSNGKGASRMGDIRRSIYETGGNSAVIDGSFNH